MFADFSGSLLQIELITPYFKENRLYFLTFLVILCYSTLNFVLTSWCRVTSSICMITVCMNTIYRYWNEIHNHWHIDKSSSFTISPLYLLYLMPLTSSSSRWATGCTESFTRPSLFIPGNCIKKGRGWGMKVMMLHNIVIINCSKRRMYTSSI